MLKRYETYLLELGKSNETVHQRIILLKRLENHSGGLHFLTAKHVQDFLAHELSNGNAIYATSFKLAITDFSKWASETQRLTYQDSL